MYKRQDYDAARDNIRAFEKEGAAESLPEQPLRTAITGDDALSPAARYHALVAELFPNGIN